MWVDADDKGDNDDVDDDDEDAEHDDDVKKSCQGVKELGGRSFVKVSGHVHLVFGPHAPKTPFQDSDTRS